MAASTYPCLYLCSLPRLHSCIHTETHYLYRLSDVSTLIQYLMQLFQHFNFFMFDIPCSDFVSSNRKSIFMKQTAFYLHIPIASVLFKFFCFFFFFDRKWKSQCALCILHSVSLLSIFHFPVRNIFIIQIIQILFTIQYHMMFIFFFFFYFFLNSHTCSAFRNELLTV